MHLIFFGFNGQNIFSSDLAEYVRKQAFLVDGRVLRMKNDKSQRYLFDRNMSISMLRDSGDSGMLLGTTSHPDEDVFWNFTMTLHAFLPKNSTIDKCIEVLISHPRTKIGTFIRPCPFIIPET